MLIEYNDNMIDNQWKKYVSLSRDQHMAFNI